MDNFPGPSCDWVREWENIVLGRDPRNVSRSRVQAQSFLRKGSSVHCGALNDNLLYLHHRNGIRHGVEIVGSEFSFTPSLDLVPGFDYFFSEPSLGLWTFRQLIQGPRDLF